MAETFLKIIDEGVRAAIWSKFYSIMGFTALDVLRENIVLYPKPVAFRKISDMRERTRMDFMNLWRESTVLDRKRLTMPAARRGVLVSYTDSLDDSGEVSEHTGVVRIKAVPTIMSYNLWFWSLDRDKLNSIAEECLFWEHNTPYVRLYFDETYPVDLNVRITGEIFDESPLDDLYKRGTYYVSRVPVEVEGWTFSDAQIKTIKTIYLKVYDRDEIEDEDIEDFIDEPNEDLLLCSDTITEDDL